MITLDNTVGRLCEIRADNAVSTMDLIAFRSRLATIFSSVPSRVVVCSDLRECRDIPDEVVQGLIGIARIDNPRIERHALIITHTQRLYTQIAGVLDAGGSSARRIFETAREARAWLQPVLTEAESDQLYRRMTD